MKLLGITGGIGMGKSTCGHLLTELGIPTLDTDHIAAELCRPGQPLLQQIVREFGPEIVAPDGSLQRSLLAKTVFSDEAKRHRLESIVHPPIREAWLQQTSEWQRDGQLAGAVIIPLLFETKAETFFTSVVCVACTPRSQLDRLHKRGWTDEQIHQRNAAQWSVQEKIDRSEFVVWTETNAELQKAQLKSILQTLGIKPSQRLTSH